MHATRVVYHRLHPLQINYRQGLHCFCYPIQKLTEGAALPAHPHFYFRCSRLSSAVTVTCPAVRGAEEAMHFSLERELAEPSSPASSHCCTSTLPYPSASQFQLSKKCPRANLLRMNRGRRRRGQAHMGMVGW